MMLSPSAEDWQKETQAVCLPLCPGSWGCHGMATSCAALSGCVLEGEFSDYVGHIGRNKDLAYSQETKQVHRTDR